MSFLERQILSIEEPFYLKVTNNIIYIYSIVLNPNPVLVVPFSSIPCKTILINEDFYFTYPNGTKIILEIILDVNKHPFIPIPRYMFSV